MKLYVMRHGPAEDRSESGLDEDRPLSVAGRARVRDVAKLLSDSNEEPLHIVTSPLVRAVQTAEIVAQVTRLGEKDGAVEVRRGLAPGSDAARLVRSLVVEGKKRVLLAGHEPDCSALVASLVPTFERPFDKAMVVGLHLPDQGPGARIRFVLDPKKLELRIEPPP
ncbi:MAG: phosphohistidine phosphatase SixA [Polyangiaceae bacterium]|jgi:phosphohistidine phosphatase